MSEKTYHREYRYKSRGYLHFDRNLWLPVVLTMVRRAGSLGLRSKICSVFPEQYRSLLRSTFKQLIDNNSWSIFLWCYHRIGVSAPTTVLKQFQFLKNLQVSILFSESKHISTQAI